MSDVAKFDANEHTNMAGWASYHEREFRGSRGLICRIRGHVYPDYRPYPLNGTSPSNYARCSRCATPIKWFVEGQHRRGWLSRYFAELA